MLGGEELKGLELRRRELVLRSTINRLAIGVELQNVQIALRPAERIVGLVRAARPWLLVLAPLAGIFAARGLRNNGSGLSKVLGILKWIQPLLVLWKQFRSPSAEAAPGTPPATRVPGAQV
jgi:hypothetical protein